MPRANRSTGASRTRISRRVLLFTVCCSFSSLLFAQQAFPLVGSWSGYWGPDASHQTRVLMSITFSVDQVISGFIIEKGRRIPITDASLDPSTWTVTMAAKGEDRESGKPIEYRIKGQIENLGSVTERTLAGTWAEGTTSGTFRVVMN